MNPIIAALEAHLAAREAEWAEWRAGKPVSDDGVPQWEWWDGDDIDTDNLHEAEIGAIQACLRVAKEA